MNNFTKRTISGIGFLAVMITAILVNKFVFGAAMMAVMVIMMWEFLKMTCGTEYRYSQILSIITGATMFILTFFYAGSMMSGRFLVLSLIPFFILMINSLYVKDKTRFEKFACLYTAIIYIALPWTMVNFAVFDDFGNFNGSLILCFFAIVWGSDVGAYVFGATLGQKIGGKLFPSISPKKSWVGFWGGMFTAVLVSFVLYFLGSFEFPWYHCFFLALVLNITGVYGDLIESQWKRHYAVKDSGNVIPGHGGMLDRFDSAILAIPSGVMYLIIFNLL